MTTSVATRDASAGATADAVLDVIDRFARRSLDPRVARPETPMAPGELESLLVEATALGIVTEGGDEGLGVWDPSDEGSGTTRSAQMLRRLARSNAGFALAVHRAALAQSIVRRLGVRVAGRGLAAVQGRFGLGRVSLARALAHAPLDDDDRAMLADGFAPGAERLVTAHERFDWVVSPVVDAAGALGWATWPRETVSVRRLAHAHGFDELATFAFTPGAPSGGAVHAPVAPAAAAECFTAALCMESIALMAIGLGAAEHAHAMARAYASARNQGGRPIEGHPAVQLLLASGRTAIATVEALVDGAARRPPGTAALGSVLAARAEAHVLLCRGANDDLQVFGGSGYMRDTGAEKIVRDLNHLRATSGSPPEIALFVAEWERVHGG